MRDIKQINDLSLNYLIEERTIPSMTRDEALFKENSCSFLVSASDPVNPLSGGRMRAIEVGK